MFIGDARSFLQLHFESTTLKAPLGISCWPWIQEQGYSEQVESVGMPLTRRIDHMVDLSLLASGSPRREIRHDHEPVSEIRKISDDVLQKIS